MSSETAVGLDRSPMNAKRGQWDVLREIVTQSTVTAPEEIWRDRSHRIASSLGAPDNAYTGRSVRVTPKAGGAAGALHDLQVILRRNNVMAEYRSQERHEKKGEKRRRLESLRWRRRFAHEVRKKVQLVNEIRARGA
ncbi:hypothetical protein CERSUDRAFT_82785 [Gelatoporia subvermispora B]|uniref:Ribosomal protein S21 n=1 Tax=Ceriporiopsis subvermispora (strain B) TaxID=914234 RepID=M2R1X4_CERS8|nr:hypothetical protein CERSUDRAFT_82785 [Gelatoporia subvermispora B]